MRKYAIVLIAALLICVTACCLVACEDETDDYIKPIAWEKYVDEIVTLMDKTYDIGDTAVGLKTAFDVRRKGGGGAIEERVEMELNFSLEPDNMTDRLRVRIVGETRDGAEETFLLYADNETMYLHVYEWSYDKHSYYRYDNAPVFDVLRANISDSLNMNGKTVGLVRLIADTVLTDANVNRDKSRYVFDFTLNNIFESELVKNIETILALKDGSTLESVLAGLGGETNIIDIIKGISGKITVDVDGGSIGGIKLNVSEGGEFSANISELAVRPYALSYEAFAPDAPEKYKNVKIGTVSVNGTVRALDKYGSSTIVTYDFELNISLDLIQLLANGWDFAALDEDNYFHLRVSHTCTTECTDFCSVELGNKLMRPNGSILDIAFAPRDFGTSNLYISASLKSFLNERIFNELIGNANLAQLLLSDYQLFTISLPERHALAAAGGGDTADAAFDFAGVEQLIAIINSLHLDLWSMDVGINEIKAALGCAAEDGMLGRVFSLLSDYGIERLAIDMGNPQYDSVRTYDIKDMTFHIATLDIADGKTGVKTYDNALLSGNFRPSLSWSFDDGEYDGGVFVNNIYQSKSNSSDKIYSTGVPISPEEIQNLKGGYLKYCYVDYLGGSGGNNTGFVKILDVIEADYSLIGEYQEITLKVGYPSMHISAYSAAAINDLFDRLLYTSVKIKVKLTALAGYTTERIDKDKSGRVIESYNQLEFNSAAYERLIGVGVEYLYADGRRKTVTVSGEADALIARGSTFFIVAETGEQTLRYSVCGKEHAETVVFNAPKSLSIKAVNQTGDEKYRATYKIKEPIKMGGLLKQLKVEYDYGGDERSMSLPVSRYFIDGEEIVKGSFEWGLIYAANDNDGSLVFYREGVFEISAEYLGQTASFELEITSSQVGNSTYQIIDKTPDRTYFSGPTYAFSAEIANKTHGSIGRAANITITVEKGRINNSGVIVYSLDENTWGLAANKFDGKDIANGGAAELPALIISPIKYDFSLYFKSSGYYKITVRLGGERLVKELEVRNTYGESEYAISLTGAGSVTCGVGEEFRLDYKLTNRIHGSVGVSAPIEVTITDRYNDPVEISCEVGNIAFNGVSVRAGDTVELPPSIFSPYDILASLKINTAGEYRVRITIGDIVSSYFNVTIA